MRKISKKAISLIVLIVLCFSLMPMSAMATDDAAAPGTDEQTGIEQNDSEIQAGQNNDIDPNDPGNEQGGEETGAPQEQPVQDEAATNIDVNPEYVKVVDMPLVQVVYHYYDNSQSISDFADYAVTSTHSYYAIATENDAGITIVANKYPGNVPVSADALRFRVLLNGSEDITAQAFYDTATGAVNLPGGFMGHDITVIWYCPASEITELPVTVEISTYQSGAFADSIVDLALASDANTISVPLAEMDNLVVSQNGIDLDESMCSMSGGSLNISASALGGDIAVTAYAPKAAGGGFTTMGTSATTVVHTRSADQIYYGYYTSYYTANGNTAFCLDPTVSGLNAGVYNISGYLQRGTGYDDLIKAAYYLYGGPGYNSVKNNLFGDPDSMEAYGLCHAAVAYLWMDNPAAFQGLSSATIDHLLRVIGSVNAQPMPPTGFDAFLYNVGSSTNQSLMGWDYTPTGNLEIQKVSSDPAKTDDNSCYSLEGAVFGIYNGNNEKIGTITTGADGKGRLEGIAAGQTGLYLLEEQAPTGYAENTAKIPFEIVSGQTTTKEIPNNPQGDPVTILLRKQDADLNTNTAQGMASLENAQFTIKYFKGNYTENELKNATPARTWIVETNANGFAMLHPDFLVAGSDPLYYASNGTTPTIPLGTVTVQETRSPLGYLLNDELYIRQVTISGKMEAVNTYNAPVVPNAVVRGGVSVQKMDFELNRPAQPQGDADLAATLDIYNRSTNSVVVGGKTYAPNTIVHTMVTDAATGVATTAANLLPYGNYEIVERSGNQPTGYLNTGKISQKFMIRENGVIVNLKTDAGAIKNNVIRGGLYLEKWDNEIDRNEAQGAGILDATVEIVNASVNLVLVEGVEYQPGEVVYTMTLSDDGKFTTSAYLLPYGTYQWREISPPSYGYLHTGVLSGYFTIREHGKIVQLNTSDTAVKNDPLRADLQGVKVSAGDAKRLANVPFKITSVTTGESHIIVTDRNGEFSTASSWNPHSQNTNRGETDRDGVWFGELWTLDDEKGALLYDTYIISEQRCPSNEPYELLEFTVEIYRNNYVLQLGTLDDPYTQTPEIFTTAMDKETMQNYAYVSETTTIVDTAYYSGLRPGLEYRLESILMDQQIGTELLVGGERIENQKTFRALSENGNVTIDLEFDSSALKGKSVVVFERLYLGDTLIAEHCDIDDAGQTVTFVEPKIGTTATGPAGEKELLIDPASKIIDTVGFENLIVSDRPYLMVGVLVDPETGMPILIDGQEQTAEYRFYAKKEAGSVTMEFEINSMEMAGKPVVVFEELYYDGVLIAEHKDIDDPGQTVQFLTPRIKTTASGEDGTKIIPVSESAKVVDVIEYENFPVGVELDFIGVLMDKGKNEQATQGEGGEPITATMQFTPKEQSGSVELEFIFDSTEMQDKILVVFESVEYKGKEIAAHADINDDAQTVGIGVETPTDEPSVGRGAQTGGDGLPIAALLAALGAAVAGAVILALRKKRIKANK